jgi:hypothetical protein
LNLLSNNPSFIGTSLNNGRNIEQDDNNKTRALCFTCIASLAGFPVAAHTLEARKASMVAPHPPTSRVQLGLLNCDWVSQCCVRKKETPGSCTLCNRPVHFECQLSWERYADLSHEKKITSQVCREHHPKYQHWQKVHIKPVEKHEKEARAKEDLNSFVWALEGEHEGAVVHQCQILNRIAEFGQVWVKWTSTGKIMCIPRSNRGSITRWCTKTQRGGDSGQENNNSKEATKKQVHS